MKFNKSKPTMKEVLDFQDKLIEDGYEEYANL